MLCSYLWFRLQQNPSHLSKKNSIEMMERLSDRKWREPLGRDIFGRKEAEQPPKYHERRLYRCRDDQERKYNGGWKTRRAVGFSLLLGGNYYGFEKLGAAY
jgi:hypothetical protein